MRTNFTIAWRYIRSKEKSGIISVIAGFSLVGIALGVAALIVVTSVMNGFRKEFTDRVIGFNGHLSVSPVSSEPNYSDIVDGIKKHAEVIQAIPIIERQGLISTNRTVSGSLVCGIDKRNLEKKELIAKNIVTGSLNSFSKEDAIILGETLARKMHVYVGDSVALYVPEMTATGLGMMPRKKTFQVVATFKSGMYEYDRSVCYIPISMAQKLFRMKNSVSTISVFTNDPLNISGLKKKLSDQYGDICNITDWQSSNSSFMKAIEIERNVMFLILTLITLVASFNIISCMMMFVKDKEKDIAILRTIGLSRQAILRIFFTIGSSIGTFGTLIGVLLGLGFSYNIQKIQAWIENIFKTKVFSPEVYFLTHLPSIVMPTDVAVTIFVSMFLSCIATLYPAYKASRLNPTEILRYA